MKNIQFQKGQKVTIYQDPITRQKSEGIAVLKQFVAKDDYPPYMETWEVAFKNEPGNIFTRRIMPKWLTIYI